MKLFMSLSLTDDSDTFQPQRDAPASAPFDARSKHHPLLIALLAEQLGVAAEQIRDFELCVYDTQPAALTGWSCKHVVCLLSDLS